MNTIAKKQKRPRVLFANFPADGHFNPLTGLAVQLINLGMMFAGMRPLAMQPN